MHIKIVNDFLELVQKNVALCFAALLSADTQNSVRLQQKMCLSLHHQHSHTFYLQINYSLLLINKYYLSDLTPLSRCSWRFFITSYPTSVSGALLIP